MLDGDIGYPTLVAANGTDEPHVVVTAASGREIHVMVQRLDDTPETLAETLRTELAGGGCVLVIRNTVGRVLETARHLREALTSHGIDVSVAHSRFLAPDRATKDRWLLDTFGSPEHVQETGGQRLSPHVVVASQVAEQSLDIDFDLLVTDLAPIDLMLQRMGRLHRHQRGPEQTDRPARLQRARCLVTGTDWSFAPPAPVAGSIYIYERHPLLRSVAVLTPHLDEQRPVRIPADIQPLVQRAYSDQPIGPAEWQQAMSAAQREHESTMLDKQARAQTFQIAPPSAGPLVGWLDTGVGEADDTSQGRAQVRDTSAETVEVIVLVRRDDGELTVPPWVPEGGTTVPTKRRPPERLAKTVATCTLGLPKRLCTPQVIEELKRRFRVPAWRRSPWLSDHLVLELDEDGHCVLAGYDLHYDHCDGLKVTRR